MNILYNLHITIVATIHKIYSKIILKTSIKMLDLYTKFIHENDFEQTTLINLTFDCLHITYF